MEFFSQCGTVVDVVRRLNAEGARALPRAALGHKPACQRASMLIQCLQPAVFMAP